MLIVGEPGCGKSCLLRYAQQLSPKGLLVNGIGSTSAGLTVSFQWENGEWTIEAGALALADGGVICIDEFNLLAKKEQFSIHEALE